MLCNGHCRVVRGDRRLQFVHGWCLRRLGRFGSQIGEIMPGWVLLKKALAGLVASGLALLGLAVVQTPAVAANSSDFDPGYIISDDDFFDSNSMTVSQITDFLRSKVSTCTYANGEACLKDYRTGIGARNADRYCSAIAGVNSLTAAQVIDRVARACGISQKVLIVLLQKEQGLVTSVAPTAVMYRSATGYGCPDTAACDSEYYGFSNQVYNAARQFKVYAANPNIWHYRPFQRNDVMLSPNGQCGTKSVYISNIATFALYTYTPYTPNTAALNNLYGRGDGCSAYGNRNFWRDYTDWFGSGASGSEAITRVYMATGGKDGRLGQALSAATCTSVGCSQEFSGGSIAWTGSGGAHPVYGAMRAKWVALGAGSGKLGYPVSDEKCGSVGCSQEFENGRTVWSASTGAHYTSGYVMKYWDSQKGAEGYLGYPTTDLDCSLSDRGCAQFFQNGVVYGTALTGPHGIRGAIKAEWTSLGWENGRLGYPVSDEKCNSSGCSQEFSGGTIRVNTKNGATSIDWI